MEGRLRIGPDGSETVEYDVAEFPMRSFTAYLSELYQYAAGCHWHTDFELLLAEEGELDCFVNGRTVHIHQGHGIFVNSGRMHYGFSPQRRECRYSCLVFHPAVLGALPMPMARYALSLGEEGKPDFLLLRPDISQGAEAMTIIRRIRLLSAERSPLYELEIQGLCGRLLKLLWELAGVELDSPRDPAWTALRQMVGFIQDRYREPIRLEQIAAAGAVCRSKCCRLFREKLDTSPIGYLNDYRLDKAAALLERPQIPVTEVAGACGFDSASYFSEAFRRRFGQSPREWRKAKTDPAGLSPDIDKTN